MPGQTIAYIRVSSTDQNPDRQIAKVGAVEETFTDEVSGKSRTERPALSKMLRHARRGDTVKVASMDRLARSVIDLAQLVQEMNDRGITVEFVSERLTFDPGADDPFATFQMHMLGSVAQLERSLIRERLEKASNSPKHAVCIEAGHASCHPNKSLRLDSWWTPEFPRPKSRRTTSDTSSTMPSLAVAPTLRRHRDVQRSKVRLVRITSQLQGTCLSAVAAEARRYADSAVTATRATMSALPEPPHRAWPRPFLLEGPSAPTR